MHSAALVAAFAAGALAAPSINRHAHHHHAAKRQDIQYEYDTVTTNVEKIVTVTAGEEDAKPTPPVVWVTVTEGEPEPTTSAAQVNAENWGGKQHGGWSMNVPAPSYQQGPPAVPTQAPASHAPAPSSAAPAAPSGGSPTGPNAYANSALAAHNVHRANHSASALQWDDSLAAAALAVGNLCNWEHSTSIPASSFPGGYGQNYAACSGTDNVGNDISGMWYDGEEPTYKALGSYGKANPVSCPPGQQCPETGHFTQLVWKGTTHVGCATASCPNGITGASGMTNLMVCNYGPPGNYGGEYAQNVGEPLGNPTVSGT